MIYIMMIKSFIEHNRKLNLFFYLMLIIIGILIIVPAYSQTTNSTKPPYSSRKGKEFYEIGKIKFIGNNNFSETDLLSVLTSKQTERSIPHKILDYYYNQIQYNSRFNSFIPKSINRTLRSVIRTMENEVRYFEKNRVEADIKTLKTFYTQNGFHNAEVDYKFYGNPKNEINTLEFIIKENKQYIVSAINWIGLDSLPSDLSLQVENLKTIKTDNPFNEEKLIIDISNILNFLTNNGYYYCNYDIPLIMSDSTVLKDSIIITFSTGKRQRISNIHYIDSTNKQSIVALSMKNKQMEFEVGDFYSRKKIENSTNNMLSLGTFDAVQIDTSSIFVPKTDTTLPFKVFTHYRKQQEYGVGIGLNQTTFDKLVNLGVEASYVHRNIFGAAQVFNPYASFMLLDINRSANINQSANNLTKFEYEYQIGVNFAQPLLFTWDQARFGFSSQLFYALRTINQTLKLETFGLPLKFPVKLNFVTYFTSMGFEFSFERQAPQNYADALTTALKSKDVKNQTDSLLTIQSFKIYGNLDRFIKIHSPYLTTSTFGFSILGDKRDNPFSPTKGYFTAISLDGLNPVNYLFDFISGNWNSNKFLGIAKYVRLQLTNYWFFSLNPRTVLALKQREGYIYWWDKLNSYVPFERQFFAGGANSVRAWPSRQLRYRLDTSNYNNQNSYNYSFDFIGSNTIIEGTCEIRYKFLQSSIFGKDFGAFMQNFGVSGFMDWGNTFHGLVVDTISGNYKYQVQNWYEYLTNLAIAAGFGFTYETPVGPVRLDFAWPLYDPAKDTNRWLFTRRNPFGGMSFNIALGHSF
jgi:outer membrane protein assembly factor BamA